jgi:hypothetical protein
LEQEKYKEGKKKKMNTERKAGWTRGEGDKKGKHRKMI